MVVEARLGSMTARAGQPLDDVAHRLVPARDLAGAGRWRWHPADLRGHVRRVADEAGAGVHQVGVDVGDLGLGAAVGPDDGRRDRLAGGGDADAAVELAGDGDRRDVRRRRRAPRERLADRRRERGEPERRVLLGPAGRGIARPVATTPLPSGCSDRASTTIAFRLCVPMSMPR